MRAFPTDRRREPRPPVPVETRSAADERAERIRLSLPLLLLAAASLAGSYVLYSEAFGGHATRVPLWVLAFSIGIIASVGGSASLLVGDYSGNDWRAEAEASDEYVVIERARWQGIQELLGTANAAALDGAASRALATDRGEPPEWSEPLLPGRPTGRLGPRPDPSEGPPAPMGITHGVESLATEVERMVADLEAAADAPATAPAVPPKPRTTLPSVLEGSEDSSAGEPRRVASPPSPARDEPVPSKPTARHGPPPPPARPANRPAPRASPQNRASPPAASDARA